MSLKQIVACYQSKIFILCFLNLKRKRHLIKKRKLQQPRKSVIMEH